METRRSFVRRLALGGAAAGLGLWRPAEGLAAPAWQPPVELSGTDFDLRIGEVGMNITGRPRVGLAVNGSIPAPTLRWREGDTVTLRVTNTLSEDTSIHWHGILLPASMDGVPGLSFDGIPPGTTHVYRFPVRQTGTYWYHSHSGFQEQRGIYGAIVIDSREDASPPVDREHVVLLSDWTDEDPRRVFGKLKKLAHYYNFNQRTIGDLPHGRPRAGLRPRRWPTGPPGARCAWPRRTWPTSPERPTPT